MGLHTFLVVVDMRVESLDFIIALDDIVIVVVGARLPIDNQVSHANNPTPEHVPGVFVQLLGQLVHNIGGTLPIESSSIVFIELLLPLSLEFPLIL